MPERERYENFENLGRARIGGWNRLESSHGRSEQLSILRELYS